MKQSLFQFLFIPILLSQSFFSHSKFDLDVKEFSFEYEDYERKYYVHYPSDNAFEGVKLPVLFVLHGGGGTAKQMIRFTKGRFNTLSDRDGFIVVYPEGVKKGWNDGRTGVRGRVMVDDVGFISKILDKLNNDHDIDESKVFTTGISNGGFMSTRLLCDRSDLFRGGAIITATISEEYLPKCLPSSSNSLLVMNGTDDPLVPYEGGEVKVFRNKRGKIISTPDFIKFWQDDLGCDKNGMEQELIDNKKDKTSISVTTYASCVNNEKLVLYKVEGGGHTWPGASQYLPVRRVGRVSKEVNASDVIWSFFKDLE